MPLAADTGARFFTMPSRRNEESTSFNGRIGLWRRLTPAVVFVLFLSCASEGPPEREQGDSRQSKARRENPLVLASGPTREGGVTWRLTLYFETNADLCLSLEQSTGRTASGCGPREIVDRYLPDLRVLPRAEYTENSTFVYGFAWKDVSTARVQSTDGRAVDVETRQVRGVAYRFFIIELSPRLSDTPTVQALDNRGRRIGEPQTPSVGGCARCTPKGG